MSIALCIARSQIKIYSNSSTSPILLFIRTTQEMVDTIQKT